MSLPQCARCQARATVHLRATGWGVPVDVAVCGGCEDVVMDETRRHPNRTRTLLVDDGQGSLFDMLGGGE